MIPVFTRLDAFIILGGAGMFVAAVGLAALIHARRRP